MTVRRTSALFGAVLTFLVLFGACAARAQDLGKPLLLVASPELQGGYSRTALLVVPMGDRHIGFILNRASNVKLSTLYPEHAPSAKVTEPVFVGGPEAAHALFALVPRNPGGSSMRLFGDVFVTANAKIIDSIIEDTPNDARYYAGFVGWRPGELAKELESGYWYTTEPDRELVLGKDTSHMWEDLVRRLGNGQAPMKRGREALLEIKPGTAARGRLAI
jgi:putative transcriptional regulator